MSGWAQIYEPGYDWPRLADSGPPEPGNLNADQRSEPANTGDSAGRSEGPRHALRRLP